jgi:hypothetical protein
MILKFPVPPVTVNVRVAVPVPVTWAYPIVEPNVVEITAVSVVPPAPQSLKVPTVAVPLDLAIPLRVSDVSQSPKQAIMSPFVTLPEGVQAIVETPPLLPLHP